MFLAGFLLLLKKKFVNSKDEKMITVRGQDFWVKAYQVGNGRWDASYYRNNQGDPLSDFAIARFNSGAAGIPLDHQLLCLGLPCFTREDAEEYVEYYLEAFFAGRHHPRVFTGGDAL